MLMPQDFSAFLGLVVLALLPIGIVMEFCYARFPIPLAVVLCIGMTVVWTILVININLR